MTAATPAPSSGAVAQGRDAGRDCRGTLNAVEQALSDAGYLDESRTLAASVRRMSCDLANFREAERQDVGRPTRLWIDCEFNEFKGELISMALVDEAGREWYEAVECESPGAWVAVNVLPIIGKPTVSFQELQASLHRFLTPYAAIHIIADWPEDIAHFCETLITGPGYRMDTPRLTLEVVRIDAASDQPHNALADARGIREAMLRTGGA